MTKDDQRRLFEAGKTLVGSDGIAKKILRSRWDLYPCLGFRNLDGVWFYGACYFPEDEPLTIE